MSSATEETVTTVAIDFDDETSLGITLPDRWTVRKRDQKRVFRAVYVDIPLPKRPYKTAGKVVPPPVIFVLEIAMPALGYGFHCWDSLHDPIAFKAIKKLLAEAPTTNGMFRTWAEVAEKEMKIVEPPLSSHERHILEFSIQALKFLDTPVVVLLRPFSYAFKLLRGKFCENAIYFIQGIGDHIGLLITSDERLL
ncbi:unnamed protein product [Calypogeia fissa]